MTGIEKADKIFANIEQFLVIISWSTTLAIMLLTVVDVLMRFLFNLPFPATWEMSEVIMPYIVVFGFAYTLTIKSHVRVTLVVDRLSVKMRAILLRFTNLISLGVCLLFAYFSWIKFWKSFLINEEILAAIRIPWWIGKFALPIGMAAFGVRYFFNLIKKES
jgi:TRAP-type C4-dicarboxylate transport system permease small subunit